MSVESVNLQIRTSPDLATRFKAEAKRRRMRYGELLEALLADSQVLAEGAHSAGMHENAGLSDRVAELEQRLAELDELLEPMRLERDMMAAGPFDKPDTPSAKPPGDRRKPTAGRREKLTDDDRAELLELDRLGIPRKGAELLEWRQRADLTLNAIAKVAGVSRAAVGQWQKAGELRLSSRRHLAAAVRSRD